MSVMVRSLELEHPGWGSADGCKEVFTSKGFPCSHCRGVGWFWQDDDQGDSEKADCPWCKGSGLMDAVVTVEWKPGDKVAVTQQHT